MSVKYPMVVTRTVMSQYQSYKVHLLLLSENKMVCMNVEFGHAPYQQYEIIDGGIDATRIAVIGNKVARAYNHDSIEQMPDDVTRRYTERYKQECLDTITAMNEMLELIGEFK